MPTPMEQTPADVPAMEDLLPEPTAQAALRVDIWLKCLVGALVVVSPSVVLGFTKDIGEELITADSIKGWDVNVLYQVVLPGTLVYAITSLVVGRLTTVIGFSMLRESGPGISIKDSVRTNMTNNGIVLALFETMLLSMWQVEGQDGGYPRNEMWYRLFLLFGIEACTRGVVMVSLFLVFLEPLDANGSKQFAVDNLLYLGEPTACIGLTMVYFLQACLLWVFHLDGKMVGLLGFILFLACVLRVMVVANYLELWRDPGLADEVRSHRTTRFQMVQGVDGTQLGRKRSSTKKSQDNKEGAQLAQPPTAGSS